MGISSFTKTASQNRIPCGGTFDMVLSVSAEPDILTKPADIVVMLDRSGSMAGSSFEKMKTGISNFIDIIEEATDGMADHKIGSGSRMGLVSFASDAIQETQLITSVSVLKSAVNSLTAQGSTNHAAAFLNALALFDPTSSNEKVMVMFTDGVTTAGNSPAPFAEAAKAQGIVIYIIGLSGNGEIDEEALKAWASDPVSAYLSITPDESALEDLFKDLAQNITKPGATNISILDSVSDDFYVTGISETSKGTAAIADEKTVVWNIPELGILKSEGAVLRFSVRHSGSTSGTFYVNDSLNYTDCEGNTVSYQDPKVSVSCGIDIIPEACPESIEIDIDNCEDSVEFDAGTLHLESLGRILQLDVTLENVCPHKRVALAIMLNELDHCGNEHKRGFKTILIPAFHSCHCKDVTVRCIKFVLPEELDVSGAHDSLCNQRRFRAQFFANYVDYDFNCCE